MKDEIREKPVSLADVWVEERHEDFLGMRYRVKEVLFSGRSDFQTVDVVDSYGHGRILLNDGLVMVSERDEFIYHDMIAHVPLFVHPKPERVLVIGGGDGGTAREVLRHKSVKQCVMVEIDAMVVEACKKFIPQTAACLEDPRLDLRIEDAVKFVDETTERFDVILVDSTDPIGPAQPLFGEKFYADVYKVLAEDGIVVSQGESPFYEEPMQEKLGGILKRQFALSGFYNFTNMTYPGGVWSFCYASKGLHPLKDFDESRVDQSGLKFEYYNKSIHRAAFAMPSFMAKNLQEFVNL